MFEKIQNILDLHLYTFNGRSITLLEIMVVPVWLIFSIWFSKWIINSVLRNLKTKNKDPNVVHLVERILYIIALTVIFLTSLSMLNVPITAFAFLSGAIAIGFGFGAQNIINNFISGWILIGEKPIRIGDFLEVEGVKGIVEEINTRSTRVKRVDGVHMLIPNSKLLENTVVNWTLRDRLIRGSVQVGVQYGSNCELVSDLMFKVSTKQPETLETPNVKVYFQDFGDNALIFEVFFWINSEVEGGLRTVCSNIRFDLYKSFKQHDITLAFPQRDVHVDGSIQVINTSR